MAKACLKTSGTSTTKGASALFGFHWSFTIMEPSGKGWPLPGTPALYAVIMVGLPTITLSTSSVRAEETTAPVLVSLEVGKRDSARRFQRVFVLCVNGRRSQQR